VYALVDADQREVGLYLGIRARRTGSQSSFIQALKKSSRKAASILALAEKFKLAWVKGRAAVYIGQN
jgi:hypothetical protein